MRHWGRQAVAGRDRRIDAWVECFNAMAYYEAHDVLEDLWLEQNRQSEVSRWLKGMIQLAGAFVHLKHHHREPFHRVHGARLLPAQRLLCLALSNLEGMPAGWMGMDVEAVRCLAREWMERIESRAGVNPWSPQAAPQLPKPGGLKDCQTMEDH